MVHTFYRRSFGQLRFTASPIGKLVTRLLDELQVFICKFDHAFHCAIVQSDRERVDLSVFVDASSKSVSVIRDGSVRPRRQLGHVYPVALVRGAIGRPAILL